MIIAASSIERDIGLFIVAGDFNKANLKTRLPKFYQHIDCATRAGKTLDHCYSNFRDAYMALSRPPFGKADHDSILLLPAYRQKLKQEAPSGLFNAGPNNLIPSFKTASITWIGICSTLRPTTTLTNKLIR